MPKKIRLGILGGGGEIVGAVFNPDYEQNIAFAEQIDIPLNRIYKDFDTLVEEELSSNTKLFAFSDGKKVIR